VAALAATRPSARARASRCLAGLGRPLPVVRLARALRAQRDGILAVIHFERAFAWLCHVDAVFSTYRPDSEISRSNAAA